MISTAALQSWLSVTGNAETLASIEAGVVAFLEDYTGRLFTSPAATVNEILDGGDLDRGRLIGSYRPDPQPWVLLKEEPNGGVVTEVYFRDSPEDPWEAQGVTDFEVDGRQLYRLSGAYPSGRRNVRVEYTFGYAEDAGPADAHLIVLEMVKSVYEQRTAGIIKQASIGPMKITYDTAMSAGVAQRLEALKRPSLVF